MGSRSQTTDESDRQQRRRHRRHSKEKKHRKPSSECISPPSYSVVEASDGNLINPTLKVTWPERPESGRHSINEYLKRRGRVPKTVQPPKDQNVISEESRVSMNDSTELEKTSSSTRRVKDPDEYCEVDELTERRGKERFAFVEKTERDKEAAKEVKKMKKDKKKAASAKIEKPQPLYENVNGDNDALEPLVSVDNSETSSKHRPRRSRASTATSEAFGTESCSSSFQTYSTTDRGSSVPIPPQLEAHFVGVHKEHTIRDFLRPTHFVLYYKRSNVAMLNDVPLSLPLTMAYMSNRGLIYHFPLKVDIHEDGRSFWHVDIAQHSKHKQPCFLSMSALINFYEGFVSLKKNGEVEVFPVSDVE